MSTVSPPVSAEEQELVEALRRGDEAAFTALLDRYGASMLRVAQFHVRTRAVAEDVVQEAWLGVLKGLDRFEGRSSLKTWIFRILTNIAKTRGERESRSVPFSSLASDDEADAPSVDPSRFQGPNELLTGNWASPPRPWDDVPEAKLLARETREQIDAAIAELPPKQREVVTLRDVEGFGSEEVCNVLDLSETNQRVLLHRARARIRAALEDYLGD
jgi:RNA polymerase sigma-70 factor, ECF subfamily